MARGKPHGMGKENYLPLLQSTSLFAGLDAEALRVLLGEVGAVLRTYSRGETLVLAGQSNRRVGVVLSGAIWLGGDFSLASPGLPVWAAEWQQPWIPRFGISLHLAVDGLSLLMVMLTSFIGVLAILCSWKEIVQRIGFFHLNLLWILGGVLGVFMAVDLFLFFFFWEMMLVPMYFLIALWGHSVTDGKSRINAATKFFIYTQASGLIMLVAILGLVLTHHASTGVFTFNYLDLLTLPAAVAGPIDPLTPAPYQRPARGVATAAAATTAAATSDNPGSALPTDSAATEVSILETVFEVLGDGYRPTTTAHPPSPAQRRWCGDLVRARPDRACLTFPRRRDDDPHHHIHAGPLVAAEKFEIEPPPF